MEVTTSSITQLPLSIRQLACARVIMNQFSNFFKNNEDGSHLLQQSVDLHLSLVFVLALHPGYWFQMPPLSQQ